MKIDLHMHSTYSDGNLPPAELMSYLIDQGVSIAALTDHDSTEGLHEAYLAISKSDSQLELITGIEISAIHPLVNNAEVHVLGYFIDYQNPQLQNKLTQFRNEREQRCRKIIDRLCALGYRLHWDDLKPTGSSIGRPHIANALYEKGYIKNPKEAFNGLLNEGGHAFVMQENISMQGAVDLIRSTGGVAVLAHPLYVKNYETIMHLLPTMGFSGFEVFYPEFSSLEQQNLLTIAHELNLLPCGGSDYHAKGLVGEHQPGAGGPPLAIFNELRAAAAFNK